MVKKAISFAKLLWIPVVIVVIGVSFFFAAPISSAIKKSVSSLVAVQAPVLQSPGPF